MTKITTKITKTWEKPSAPLHDNSGNNTPKTALGGRQTVDSERALDKLSEAPTASRTVSPSQRVRGHRVDIAGKMEYAFSAK
jgi:hypothetical protein